MRSSKLEWFQFYPRDWLSDPKLARASIATRGIWLELISAMFIEELHFVAGDRGDLARLARCDADDIDRFISEAQRYGFADVTDCNGTFTVTCRRLAREQKERGRIREAVRAHRSNRASAAAGNENVNESSTSAPEPCNGDVTSVSVSNSVSLSGSSSGGKSVRRGVAVTWPEGFALDDGMRAYAIERGVTNPQAEFDAFREWALSKAARYVDWRAAWRTRINNIPRFGGARASPARTAETPIEMAKRRLREAEASGNSGSAENYGNASGGVPKLEAVGRVA